MSRKGRTKVWIEYAAVRAALGMLGLLPRRASVRVGGALVRAAGRLLAGRFRRTAMRNLELAFPEKSAAERLRVLEGSFTNVGRLLGELSHFSRTTREDLNRLIEFDFEPETLELFEKLRAEGRGAIILSPHMGNWELLVFAWSALREPISYLARPLDNPLLEEFTQALRTRFGNRPIGKTNAIPTALGVLREAGILGILADVNAHPKEGVFVPFFGVPACTSTGPAMLAIRTGAMMVPMAGVWDEQKGKYVAVHGRIIIPPETGERTRNIEQLTAAFTAEIEALIRKYPDQWLWFHRRWKTRPPGEPALY
jgi:Kdo2-lipid IVA lauroyltransferase/acyltransferase